MYLMTDNIKMLYMNVLFESNSLTISVTKEETTLVFELSVSYL